MKELSIEEKARCYDKAIERAKSLIGDTIINESGQHIAEVIFPELAESDDERVRKELIEFVKSRGGFKQEYITWLEKQGEQSKKHDVCDTCDEKDSCISPCCVKLVEEQGGQKPVGFNIGDEITVNGQVCRVVAVDNTAADTREYDFHGIKFIPKFKEGDVIRDKKRGETTTIRDFSYDTGLYTHTYGQFPITIQDDYEKIKPIAWSEEDEAIWAEISDLLGEGYKQSDSKFSWDDMRNWVNSKLKSIKPQKTWKPSNQQMLAVCTAIGIVGKYTYTGLYLQEVLEQVKKLMEE